MNETTPIVNTDDIIDSRDIINRLDWLCVAAEEGPITEDEQTELAALRLFAESAEDATEDWLYGAPLIRDSYFVEYTRDLVQDCYTIPDGWPWRCIDWVQAAEELQRDYTDVDFGGVRYWTR